MKFIAFSKKNEKITTVDYLFIYFENNLILYDNFLFEYQTHKKGTIHKPTDEYNDRVIKGQAGTVLPFSPKIAEDFFFLVFLSYKFFLFD